MEYALDGFCIHDLHAEWEKRADIAIHEIVTAYGDLAKTVPYVMRDKVLARHSCSNTCPRDVLYRRNWIRHSSLMTAWADGSIFCLEKEATPNFTPWNQWAERMNSFFANHFGCAGS